MLLRPKLLCGQEGRPADLCRACLLKSSRYTVWSRAREVRVLYVRRWHDFPEVEVLPNNHRTSIAGLNVGVNRIRWVHPTATPRHSHDDAEQVILMLSGRIEMTIDDQKF